MLLLPFVHSNHSSFRENLDEETSNQSIASQTVIEMVGID